MRVCIGVIFFLILYFCMPFVFLLLPFLLLFPILFIKHPIIPRFFISLQIFPFSLLVLLFTMHFLSIILYSVFLAIYIRKYVHIFKCYLHIWRRSNRNKLGTWFANDINWKNIKIFFDLNSVGREIFIRRYFHKVYFLRCWKTINRLTYFKTLCSIPEKFYKL